MTTVHTYIYRGRLSDTHISCTITLHKVMMQHFHILCLFLDKINTWQVHNDSADKPTLSQSRLLKANTLMKMYPESVKTL